MQKVHVKSFGCSANIAEGEMIKGQFAQENAIVELPNDADSIVLNICTVKGDKNALDEIRGVKKKFPDKKITITGCITPSIVQPIKLIDPSATLINTHHIPEILSFVNTKTDALSYAKPIKLMMPRVRTNPVIGIVPISSGCLDACAFCSTRLVKGVLFSFPPEVIEREVQKCVEDGCREIWITGQDTCCYGFDRKTNLAVLLKKLVEVPGDFKIRVGMGNPRHLPKFLPELVEVMKHDKIFRFIHLPLQAGNDAVLKAMRRGHSVQQVKDIINLLRKEIPEMTISTDIIVGHPTETEKQFEDTVKLVQELKIDNMNIARFASRPGTSAASMDGQVHGNVSKERSRKLTQAYRTLSLTSNRKWLGWKGEVIVDQKKEGGVEARNYAYKTVFIRQDLPLGAKVDVNIIDAQVFFLEGQVVKE
ncbi:MAG TPA: tRNA (N(6)-L-threonylcarbamoyladenosine(37)-C(2))-methylthiotransferase [Candidatus Nanoarchaeia archaeon]|nr:tRNA (N(6)-L-threonylcarbamoyladenosine(37)-C(2))-methylthiotransferase [Candidatus Nanoarchaeia archaeon]